jgi:hypothetical protein
MARRRPRRPGPAELDSGTDSGSVPDSVPETFDDVAESRANRHRSAQGLDGPGIRGRACCREGGTLTSMPLQNRVTPLGQLIADPARGLVYGNRGCIHDAQGRIRNRYPTRRWIACRLEYRNWYRSPEPRPGCYTGLFFLDEATALAAGHRPCALCRRADHEVFTSLAARLDPALRGAEAIDLRLDAERRADGGRRLHDAAASGLPDGAFVLRDGEPWVVRGGELLRWTPAGYTDRVRRSGGRAVLLTPPTLVELLREERTPLVPLLHPTAG